MPPLQAIFLIIVIFGVLVMVIVGMAVSAWHWLKNRFGGCDDIDNVS